MKQLTEEEKYYRMRRWLVIVVPLAIVIIVFLLIKGCNNEKAANLAYSKVMDTVKALMADTSRIYAISRAYKEDAEQMKLRYAEVNDDKNLLQKQLISESDKNDRLFAAVQKAKNDKDTIQLVKYIDTLSSENKALTNRVRHLIAKQKEADSIQQKRLIISDSLANHWETAYRGCIKTAEFIAGELPKIKPKSKLYIDVAATTGYVNGLGGGFSLIDKKGNKFGVKGFITTNKPLYLLEYGRLLSLKRKR